MYLKRLYDKSDPQNPRVNGVRILSLGATTDQHFSPELVADAILQGWMEAGDGKLTIQAEGQRVEYQIRRGPGFYCCHCGEKLPGMPGAPDPVAFAARQWHVADQHAGVASPDVQNPAGYEGISYYDCVELTPRPEREG